VNRQRVALGRSKLVWRDPARLRQRLQPLGCLGDDLSVGHRVEENGHQPRREDVAGRPVVISDDDGLVARVFEGL